MISSPAPRSKWASAVERILEGAPVPCEVVLRSGETVRVGAEPPKFRLTLHTNRLIRPYLDELAFGEAYVNGEVDIDGDMSAAFALRALLKDRLGMVSWLRFWSALLLLSRTRINRKAIAHHYEFGDEFFRSFTDTRYHLYSHGLFKTDEDSLEQASEHKLETMFEALELKPGMRLLDIGAGWGAVARYCAPKGVQVTSLTLADDSRRFVEDVIAKEKLDAQVIQKDFLEHQPERPYDAIVIFGVIEHIPFYRRFAERVWQCLKPGGLMYLDGSATLQKYDVSSFTRRYIWHGPHTFMCLQDVIRELLLHGFELNRVCQESHDYELTMRHWARRFEERREQIVASWGEQIYRAFRMYLWGGHHSLATNDIQAYHLVVRRNASPGPRPGLLQRVHHFLREQF